MSDPGHPGTDRAEEADAVEGGEAAVEPLGQRPLVGGDRVPADRAQGVDGGVQCDGADHVGRAGLLAVGGCGPDDLVEADQVDGAAPGEEGVPGREQRPRADGAPEPNGAYSLCPLRATKSAVVGRGRCGASWAPSTTTGTPRVWAASMMASIGGTQPVTLDAPVTASSAGLRSPGASRAAVTSSTPNVPSVPHST